MTTIAFNRKKRMRLFPVIGLLLLGSPWGCKNPRVNEAKAKVFQVKPTSPLPVSAPNTPTITNLRSLGFACTDPTTPIDKTGKLNPENGTGQRLSVRCKGHLERNSYPLPISLFIPSTFQINSNLHLILHMHGFLVKPVETDVFGRFSFEQKLESSGINAILVIPESENKEKTYLDQWRNNSARFETFVTALADLFRQTQLVADVSQPNQDIFRHITITGHSGAFRPIAHLYNYQGIYKNKIKAIGLFDAMFSKSTAIVSSLAGWGQRLSQNNGFNGLFVHVSGSRTRDNAGLILNKINPTLSHQSIAPENVQQLNQNGCYYIEVAPNKDPEQHWNIFNDFFVPFIKLSDHLR